MELTESMFRYLAEKVCGSAVLSYNGTIIDMSKPFERITMMDAVKKYSGVDFTEVKTDEEAKKLADEHHVAYEARHKKGDIINLFFEEFCEDKMIPVSYTHLDVYKRQLLYRIYFGLYGLPVHSFTFT